MAYTLFVRNHVRACKNADMGEELVRTVARHKVVLGIRDEENVVRATRLIKAAMKRLMKRQASVAVTFFQINYGMAKLIRYQERMKAVSETTMKRATSRMMNRDISHAWIEFIRNYKKNSFRASRDEILRLKTEIRGLKIGKSRAIMKALFAQFRALATHKLVHGWRTSMEVEALKEAHDAKVLEVINAFT